MNSIFKSALPGYSCGECSEVFLEPNELSVTENIAARSAIGLVELHCPFCGSWDLDEVRVCTNCEQAVATDGEHCTPCATAIAAICNHEFEDGYCIHCEAEEIVRRDSVSEVKPLLKEPA